MKELEDDGIIIRETFGEIPPRVEYSLSEKGLELLPILNSIMIWNNKYENKESKLLFYKREKLVKD